jgi:hypothetical protein
MDGSIFERYDTARVRIFAIGENSSQISEFRDVFGMRFVGLVDSSGVYQAYRVPNPQAPYPQDYVIDQQGVVRYWSDQFDPQEVIRVIDRLLGPGVEQQEQPRATVDEGRPCVNPNPFRTRTSISLQTAAGKRTGVAVFDAAGRLVRTIAALARPKSGSVSWDGTDDAGRRLPSGVYYVRSRAAGAMPVLLLR